jgi:crossover junction endodeoxyribonuclease RuvC
VSIILACDPGSVRTGWACIETKPLTYLDSGVIALGDGDFWERIGALKARMEAIIQNHAPHVLVLERVFVSLNKQTALKLAQIRGALMGLSFAPCRQYAEYSPREVKMQITGYGAASKEQMALMIRKSIQDIPSHMTSFDESDAIAIALCHAYTMIHLQRFVMTRNT